MSTERPYYLLGQQQLNRLAEQMRAALIPLTGRWWPTAETVQIIGIGNFYESGAFQNGAASYFLQHNENWLALFGPERTWLALVEGWLGCNVATMTELVQTLLRAFCSELFCALSERKSAPTIRTELPWSQMPAGLTRPGSGTLLVELNINGCTLNLLLSAALWPHLAEQSTRRSQKKLTPCHTALGACRVHLDAVLPSAQVPLTDIATLAVGDFLNLGHDLSGQIQLQGRDIALTLPAAVGQNGVHKAIKLTGIKYEKSA